MRSTVAMCPGGGIGRRTSFRCWRWQHRGGSSPFLGTKGSRCRLFPINWKSRATIRSSLRYFATVSKSLPVNESDLFSETLCIVTVNWSSPCIFLLSWASFSQSSISSFCGSHTRGICESSVLEARQQPHFSCRGRAFQARKDAKLSCDPRIACGPATTVVERGWLTLRTNFLTHSRGDN